MAPLGREAILSQITVQFQALLNTVINLCVGSFGGFSAMYLGIPFWDMVKVKVNFTLEQATKAQRWSRGVALLFL
jgi:hypothetical protein